MKRWFTTFFVGGLIAYRGLFNWIRPAMYIPTMLGSPLFPRIEIRRGNGTTITVTAPQARADAPYVQGLRVNGRPSTRPWLPEEFIQTGGTLEFALGTQPNRRWGSKPEDAPPSFNK